MSDTPPEKPKRPPAQFLQQNLQSFLQSSYTPPEVQSNDSNTAEDAPPPATPNLPAALQLRMNQMELANRLKLKGGEQQKAVPMVRGLPPGGFGSAQGIMHLRRGDFGKKPEPRKDIEPKLEDENPESQEATNAEEVFEVPNDSEFRLDRQGKKPRRFQNPSL